MASSIDRQEVARIAASLRAIAEYQREMGLTELLRSRHEPEPPRRAEAVPATGPSGPSRAGALEALRSEIGDCTRCPLHEGRKTIVFGEGNPEARLAFVGEGPGHDEDVQGRPFVGAAGQLLTRIINAIGLERGDVYICNVVKCRPPQNRAPEPGERQTCGPFLEKQLRIVAPEVIVCLGATAASFILSTDRPVGRLRGKLVSARGADVMVTYHPAYLLRTPEAKRPVWEDMKLVRDRLGLGR